MRLAIPISLLLLTFSSRLLAQPHHIDRVDITNWGRYDVVIAKSIDDRHLAGGRQNVVADRKNLEPTATIAARLCVSFGFEYVLVGTPTNVDVPIRMVTRFPAAGVRNPETGLTTHRHEAIVMRTIGRLHFRSYTLEREWEVVPGTWTFELWDGDRKLVERSFMLTHNCDDNCDRIDGDRAACDRKIALATSSQP
jgi:hypothetical protein